MEHTAPAETANIPKEVERKFVVDPQNLPANLAEYPSSKIRQGYGVIGSDGSEWRLRDRDGSYFTTVKSKGTLSRGEWEVELTADQFEALWPSTEGRRVEKTRYRIPHEDEVHTIEVDVYEGQLEGLVTAEIECASEAEAAGLAVPGFCVADVTEDQAFKNQQLALNGLPG